MNLALHHFNLRKRAAEGALEPYPARDAFRRRLDTMMIGVGILQPLALVPQVYAIYVDHHTAGISVPTWGMLTVFNILWAVYGIAHKDVPVTTANVLLAILDLSIVIGVFLF